MENIHNDMIQFTLIHPPFWFSMLESIKKVCSYLLEGKYWRSLSQEAFSHLPSSLTWFTHWIPWLVIQRAMLSSLTDPLVLPINSFTIFDILLRNRHQPNWTSCVSSASECTASQSATLTSVKGILTVPKVLPTYLLGSKSREQAGCFAAKHLTMPYSGICPPHFNHEGDF